MTEITPGSYRLDGAGSGAIKAGAAFMYHRTGTTWAQIGKIFDTSRVSGDEFGFSVAISGDYAIVGSPGVSHGTGQAVVYKWSTEWILVSHLYISLGVISLRLSSIKPLRHLRMLLNQEIDLVLVLRCREPLR